MLLALLVILGVAVDDADGQWATSSFGYAASSVDAYIYGSGTTLFNGISSNSPSYAPPAPTPATCASRGSRARCEDVALYDGKSQQEAFGYAYAVNGVLAAKWALTEAEGLGAPKHGPLAWAAISAGLAYKSLTA